MDGERDRETDKRGREGWTDRQKGGGREGGRDGWMNRRKRKGRREAWINYACKMKVIGTLVTCKFNDTEHHWKFRASFFLTEHRRGCHMHAQ